MFVVDATDRERINKARVELNRISKDKLLENLPYLLLFNKTDLEDKRMSLDELRTKLNFEVHSQKRTMLVHECSALTGKGIWEGLSALLDVF